MKTDLKRISILVALALVAALAATVLLAGCGGDDDDDDDVGVGTLEFYANGEEFIRNGFVGKTGWDIAFSNFWVNLDGVTAFQVAEEKNAPCHAGHDHGDIPEGAEHAYLEGGPFWVDLHQGDDRALLGTVTDAVAGNYNYLNFNMIQTDTGDYSGYSIVMVGTATKDEETVAFTIKLDEQMKFNACHQETDDEYAGVVADGDTGSMELTFHSDHLFGDIESIDDPDSVNPGATGFQPFADLAVDGLLDIDQTEMSEQLSTDDYTTFIAALFTLGHSGEGHCGYEVYEEDAK
ncbi:MAG: hypothetical protein P9M14_10315 [Candidatus Alcyoniella australis]|nr:hypothetical protein [Candidatus Alcyoniella australis]